MLSSWIQEYIIVQLLRNSTARRKDLCPEGIESNLFTYHLDKIVTGGLITKTDRGIYSLTSRGQRYAGTMSTATNHATESIKTVVMMFGKHGDGYLMFRWSRQPYLGKATPLYDRVPYGKSMQDGINSALNDKLGQHIPVRFLTSALIKIYHKDFLITHMNTLIYYVSTKNIELPHQSRNGEAYISTLNSENLMDGVPEFLDKVEHAKQPFESLWRY